MTSIQSVATTSSPPAFRKLDNGVYCLIVYPRIHMFSLDLSLKSGILKHGSIGFSLKGSPIEICVKKSLTHADVIDSEIEINNLDGGIDFNMLRSYIRNSDYWDVTIKANKDVRTHMGLGISTQIMGGILLCCAKTSGVNLTIDDLFRLGVGHASTLGLNLLFNPGFIVEMGCEITDMTKGVTVNPSLYSHYEKPTNFIFKITDFPYYVVLAIPKKDSSLSLTMEDDFWDKLLPDTQENTDVIMYEVFQHLLPSIGTENYTGFIESMKHLIAMGTKNAEENIQPSGAKVILERFREEFGFAGVSSMGPTIYTFSRDNPSTVINFMPKSHNYQFLTIKGV